ncbi:sugar isomerase, partial [Candidatus Woesearchaeota archaeon]
MHIKELVVKPILIYYIYKKREATSWRPWGGIHTLDDVHREEERINKELGELQSRVEFKLKILPLSSINSVDKLDEIKDDLDKADVLLLYAASVIPPVSGKGVLEKLVNMGKHVIFFLRYKSGPVYLWYEIIHPRFLRRMSDDYVQPNVSINDIVVDKYDALLWRLRALFGLKNTIGRRVVAIGGASGWNGGGVGRVTGPYLARNFWKLDIIEVSYDELGARLREAKEKGYLDKARRLAEEYLSDKGVKLVTNLDFVVNGFLVYLVFKDLLREYDADVITVNECMTTIIPIAETTACLALSLLNDEGYLAFCESDFVVIPAGILLH